MSGLRGRAGRAAAVGGALAAATAALGLAYAYLYERERVALDRYTVELEAADLPASGLCILHLSDFHFRAGDAVQARKVARLLALLRDEHYDVVALTGDLIHDWSGLPLALDLIRGLHPTCAAFFCPGNHDYVEYSVWGVFGRAPQADGDAERTRERPPLISRGFAAVQRIADFALKVARNDLVRLPVAFNDIAGLQAELAACGVEALVNRAIPLPCRAGEIWFAGVDDLLEGRPDLAAALSGVPAGAPVVLLAHNPDVWLEPAVRAADLVLSGHTHGGQIRLPLIGAAHTQGTHLTRRQPDGWFAREGQQMFVIRGLGESIPLRFGVRPQAALIRLLPGRAINRRG